MLSKATVVVTDSFHGTVFSILFGRDFYTIGNADRGNTRIHGMLQSLGLETRLVTDLKAADITSHDINWNQVHTSLVTERKKSMEFLANSLN